MVAFLGGVNVGGHRVTMDRLRAEFVDLGHPDARTFIASGNVVFDVSGRRSPNAVASEVEAHLTSALGFPVPAFVRRARDLAAIAAYEPFGAVPSGSTLQIVFLRTVPTAAQARAANALSTALDRLAVHGTELYWQVRGGVSDTGIKPAVLRRALGQTGTARNVTSLRKLVSTL